jgi:hypothetical protein
LKSIPNASHFIAPFESEVDRVPVFVSPY